MKFVLSILGVLLVATTSDVVDMDVDAKAKTSILQRNIRTAKSLEASDRTAPSTVELNDMMQQVKEQVGDMVYTEATPEVIATIKKMFPLIDQAKQVVSKSYTTAQNHYTAAIVELEKISKIMATERCNVNGGTACLPGSAVALDKSLLTLRKAEKGAMQKWEECMRDLDILDESSTKKCKEAEEKRPFTYDIEKDTAFTKGRKTCDWRDKINAGGKCASFTVLENGVAAIKKKFTDAKALYDGVKLECDKLEDKRDRKKRDCRELWKLYISARHASEDREGGVVMKMCSFAGHYRIKCEQYFRVLHFKETVETSCDEKKEQYIVAAREAQREGTADKLHVTGIKNAGELSDCKLSEPDRIDEYIALQTLECVLRGYIEGGSWKAGDFDKQYTTCHNAAKKPKAVVVTIGSDPHGGPNKKCVARPASHTGPLTCAHNAGHPGIRVNKDFWNAPDRFKITVEDGGKKVCAFRLYHATNLGWGMNLQINCAGAGPQAYPHYFQYDVDKIKKYSSNGYFNCEERHITFSGRKYTVGPKLVPALTAYPLKDKGITSGLSWDYSSKYHNYQYSALFNKQCQKYRVNGKVNRAVCKDATFDFCETPYQSYSYRFLGCFKDAGNRDMGPILAHYVHDQGRLREQCRDLCDSKNKKYFAVQANGECFCDDTYGKYKEKGPECHCENSGQLAFRKVSWWANCVYEGIKHYKSDTAGTYDRVRLSPTNPPTIAPAPTPAPTHYKGDESVDKTDNNKKMKYFDYTQFSNKQCGSGALDLPALEDGGFSYVDGAGTWCSGYGPTALSLQDAMKACSAEKNAKRACYGLVVDGFKHGMYASSGVAQDYKFRTCNSRSLGWGRGKQASYVPKKTELSQTVTSARWRLRAYNSESYPKMANRHIKITKLKFFSDFGCTKPIKIKSVQCGSNQGACSRMIDGLAHTSWVSTHHHHRWVTATLQVDAGPAPDVLCVSYDSPDAASNVEIGKWRGTSLDIVNRMVMVKTIRAPAANSRIPVYNSQGCWRIEWKPACHGFLDGREGASYGSSDCVAASGNQKFKTRSGHPDRMCEPQCWTLGSKGCSSGVSYEAMTTPPPEENDGTVEGYATPSIAKRQCNNHKECHGFNYQHPSDRVSFFKTQTTAKTHKPGNVCYEQYAITGNHRLPDTDPVTTYVQYAGEGQCLDFKNQNYGFFNAPEAVASEKACKEFFASKAHYTGVEGAEFGAAVKPITAKGFRIVAGATTGGHSGIWDIEHIDWNLDFDPVEGFKDCKVVSSGYLLLKGEALEKKVSGKMKEQYRNVYHPYSAFDPLLKNSRWGGRKDKDGKLWIGVQCTVPRSLTEMTLYQTGGHTKATGDLETWDGSKWKAVRTNVPLKPALDNHRPSGAWEGPATVYRTRNACAVIMDRYHYPPISDGHARKGSKHTGWGKAEPFEGAWGSGEVTKTGRWMEENRPIDIHIGGDKHGGANKKCVKKVPNLSCKTNAGDPKIRINTDHVNHPDTFIITVEGDNVCAKRTDNTKVNGWGMNLKIRCSEVRKMKCFKKKSNANSCPTASDICNGKAACKTLCPCPKCIPLKPR